MASAELQPRQARWTSLDVFRGLTIAAMLIVNNPGSSGHVFAPLRHADWHGCTPADFVFPFFLFMVGASVPLSRRVAGVPIRRRWRPVMIRAAVIFGLGLLLAAVPRFDPATLRIPGVLQRIAVCYAATALLAPSLRPGDIAALGTGVLAGYHAAIMYITVPGYGAGDLSVAGNIVGYIDRTCLGLAHLLGQQPFDPEGLLSTVPALVTTWIGYLSGCSIVSKRGADAVVATASALRMIAAGVFLAVGGWALGAWSGLPINKQLWTPAFVLFTGGSAMAVLGVARVLFDGPPQESRARKGISRRAIGSLSALGANAILVYVGSGLAARALTRVPVSLLGHQTVQEFVFNSALLPMVPGCMPAREETASLLYALLIAGAWLGVAWMLHKRGWRLRA